MFFRFSFRHRYLCYCKRVHHHGCEYLAITQNQYMYMCLTPTYRKIVDQIKVLIKYGQERASVSFVAQTILCFVSRVSFFDTDIVLLTTIYRTCFKSTSRRIVNRQWSFVRQIELFLYNFLLVRLWEKQFYFCKSRSNPFLVSTDTMQWG